MKNWKILLLLVMLSLFGLSFQSCDDDNEKEDTTPYIGVLLSGQDNAWHRAVKDYAVKALEKNNIQYYYINSAKTASQQVKQIDEAIEQGCKILVVSLEKADQSSYAKIKEVIKNGTKVIFLEDERVIDNYTAKVYVDNKMIGAAAAGFVDAATLTLDIQSVAVIGVVDGTSKSDERFEGFKETLSQKAPGIRIEQVEASAYDYMSGYAVATALLENVAQYDAIYAIDDEIAFGVLHAIESVNMVTGIKVLIGCGGEATFMGKIKIGQEPLLATTVYSPAMVSKCIDLAVRVLKKKSVTKDNLIEVGEVISRKNVDAYTPSYSLYMED